MKELKELKKVLIKDWGKKCKDKALLCPKCLIWGAYDTIDEMYDVTGKI